MQPCYAGVVPYPEEPRADDNYFPPLEDDYFPPSQDDYFPAPRRDHSPPAEQDHARASRADYSAPPERYHSPEPEHDFDASAEQGYSALPSESYSAPPADYPPVPAREPRVDPAADFDTATLVFPQPDLGPADEQSGGDWAEEPDSTWADTAWAEEPDSTWADTAEDASVDHADGAQVEDPADPWFQVPGDSTAGDTTPGDTDPGEAVELAEGPPVDDLDDATVVFSRVEDETEDDSPAEDFDDDATIVFSLADYEPAPPPAETAPVSDTGTGGRAIGKKAAVGAVVAGGLVAGQIGWSAAFADEGAGADHPSTLAASVRTASILPVPDEPDAGMINQRDIDALHKGDDLAMQAAFAHAASAHAVRANTAPTQAARQREAMVLSGGGNLDDWISVALQKLRLDDAWAPSVKRIILEESRGNPRAINRWDSNAVAGRPSQGLMQVIPTTYLRYVLPELAGRPITDPVANITAGIRYMLSNYGYLTLSRGGRYNAYGQYVGY